VGEDFLDDVGLVNRDFPMQLDITLVQSLLDIGSRLM
jgi:hypothetical protein